MKYFEDFVVAETAVVGSYHLAEVELLAFAHEWDPQPQHIDSNAAESSPFGGLIASGVHTLAVTVRLLVTHQSEPVAVVAALGWDKVRFLAPVRAGDVLTLSRRCLSARPSQSHPDRGIVRNVLMLSNQSGTLVLSYEDTILVRMRASSGARPGSAA